MEYFDYEELRKDLIDYYGTAMSLFPVVMFDIERIRRANYAELIKCATEENFDLEKYFYDNKNKRR